MTDFTPGDLGFVPVRLIGGPLDGQSYEDMPVFPNGEGASSVAMPLGETGPTSEYARYKKGHFDPETEMWLYDYVGIEVGGAPVAPVQTGDVDSATSTAAVDEHTSAEGTSTDEEKWEPARRYVIEQSWWLASELCRRHPHLRIYEMHPADGMYDVLRVFVPLTDPVGMGEVIDMNREGRIHLHDVETFKPVSWSAALAAQDPHDIVKQIESWRGWELTRKGPATTPTTLVYRLISRVLTKNLNGRNRWDARSIYLDHAIQSSRRIEFIDAFPAAEGILTELRESTPEEQDCASRMWVILRDETPMMLLDDRGFAHSKDGTRTELLPLYKTSGSLDGTLKGIGL
jgi:hypothetical protein